MDKLKLAQLGERLKTGGAQMGEKLKTGGAQMGEKLMTGGSQVGRLVSGKMREILQTPTPESKMVDEATLETMEEPNWGLNLRICAMINSEAFNGSEIVRAIKKKFLSKSVVSQRLSLDLLEACTMNCEKVFSEVASEKVLDEMVRMIDNPQTDQGIRDMAMQLIRAWGESEDLAYLSVFRQTYMSLKGRVAPPPVQDGNSPPTQHSLESLIHRQSLSPHERYPIPDSGLHDAYGTNFLDAYGSLSVEEKKEVIVEARNSLELLSSILNIDTEPKPLQDDLTVSILEKCKQSRPVIQRIVESTTDDEVMLFDALNLHEELQLVISRYEELEAGPKSREQLPENSDTAETDPDHVETQNETKMADPPKGESTESSCEVGTQNEPKMADPPKGKSTESSYEVGTQKEAKITDSSKGDYTESSGDKRNVE